ncbi:hypothetical protein ACHWQZ_G001671 [Mnemiopsis leidyi]
MITTLLWATFYNAVWLVSAVEVCKLPDPRNACKLDEIKFTGTAIHTDIPVKDFETCALYCMWSEEKCFGVSFEVSDQKSGKCTLLSKVSACELDQKSWTSGFDCFSSQIGDLYKWEMFPNDVKRDIDGSHLVEEGRDVVLNCGIPRLNDIFISLNFRWYKRTDNSSSKDELLGNDHELILKSVKRPSADHAFDGLYRCEIEIFSKIVIRSPEELLRVVYLGKILTVPKATSFTNNDEYVMLDCTPSDSYPPAIVEWYQGRPDNYVSVSDVSDLNYMVVEGKLVIINPTKSIQNFYFCRVRNMISERSENSNPVLVNCNASGSCDVNSSNITASNDLKIDELDIATSLDALQNERGVWLEKEKAFRCFFGILQIGKQIVWTYEGKSFDEKNAGVRIMEGGQVLMLTIEKILELYHSAVKEVVCSVQGESYTISLPTVAVNDPVDKKFMLNLDPDMKNFDITLGTILKEEDITRNVGGDKYLFASIDVSGGMNIGHSYLNFLALQGDPCGEYKLPSCSFNDVALGDNAINSSCPGVTAYCKLHSLTETSYWIDDTRSGCKLDQINNSGLDSVDILEGQLVNLTLSGKQCFVSSQMLLQEFDEYMSFYSNQVRLSAVLRILGKMKASMNVSSTFRTRAKELTLMYIKISNPLDGNKIIVNGENIDLILWEVNFPLTENASLEFPSLTGDLKTKSELTLTLPVGLNEIPALTGSQSFLVSLYHKPDTDYNELSKGRSYASKVVDIDPPTKLSNLEGNQEIKIGLYLTDENKFDSANYPECYWYDSANNSWTTDGVTTVFQDGTVQCSTTHLTAFSALMSAGLHLPPEHEKALSYLTYILGGLSCVALVFTLVALLAFKEIRRSPSNKIHVCLTTTMLLAMVLFFGGAKKHNGTDKTICKVVAIMLHYLWLTVFMWTVVESYNLYLLFIRILSARSSTFIFKFVIPVFAIPGVIVGLTAGFSYDSYADENYCLLRHSIGDEVLDRVIYYSFYLPIGVSIVVNGSIFIAVVIKVFKKGRYQRFENKIQKVLSQIKAVLTLSCVLGLTWALGFLTFDHPAKIVFHYLFTICNCIQGLLIFFFHCAIKPDIYQKWLSFLFHKESKSAPSSRNNSRSNTPTKSRLDLFTGIFQKRSSTVTLSTTATKMSLTKQLTRQRSNSKDSLGSGIQTALALMKKASLEPLQEKDSSTANVSPKEERQGFKVRKKMLSSHSSHGSMPGNDITPPGNAIPNYFDFMDLETQETKPRTPKRSLPRSIVHAETKIRNVVAAIIPDQHSRPPTNTKKESPIATNKDHVFEVGRNMNKNRQLQAMGERVERRGSELNLEDRLFGTATPDSEVELPSSCGKRSISPMDLIKGWRRVSPSPPIPPDFPAPVDSKKTFASDVQLNQPFQPGQVKEVLSPKGSLEIKPPLPITSKLSQLEEWIL